MVKFGFACINETLKKKGICFKRCQLSSVFSASKPYDYLISYGRQNLYTVQKILEWNVQHNIRFYRLSSSMFPHIGNPRILDLVGEDNFNDYISLRPFLDILNEIKQFASKHKIRLSVHPGQFVQLASPKPHVVKNAIIDLTWHSNLLTLVGDKDSTICIHGGGTWGDKNSAIKRLEKQILKLPCHIKNKLCLENCEKSWSVEDLLPVCKRLDIPLIFDFFHYKCYSLYHKEIKQRSISELMPLILTTWKDRRPKFHISEQCENSRHIGAHSAYVFNLPRELIVLKKGFDVMIEAKRKEENVLYLAKKYLRFV
jgi:UV DNA damage endonuclease